jgi:hypothetical protein
MNPTLKAIKLLMLIMTLAIFGGIALAVAKLAEKTETSSVAKPAAIAGCGELLCVLMTDGSIAMVKPEEGVLKNLTTPE